MKVNDIFTPGKLPTWTYVDDHLKGKGQQLLDALEDGSTLVSISGPSKSGKTVFVEHLIGKNNLIQVTGAGIHSTADLWLKVFHLIGTSIPSTITTESSKSGTIASTGGLEGNAIVGKVKGEVSSSGTFATQNAKTKSIAIDYLQLLIQEVTKLGLVIFIDDFHYIPRDVQSDLTKQIKEAIRQGVKFICASVPYHSDDVIRSNPDLRGRIFSIDFDYWGYEVLKMIAHKGFQKANIECNEIMINLLATESAGSPQLMQYLCLNTCYEVDVRDMPRKTVRIGLDQNLFESICKRTVQSTNFSSVVNKMIEGPKPRGSDRKIFMSKDGWQGDVYSFLIKALSLNPPQLNFRYQSLVYRISKICENDTPSGSSITSACHYATIIANDAAEDKIIEWDSDNDVFDIRDPYFLFYLRWAEIIG